MSIGLFWKVVEGVVCGETMEARLRAANEDKVGGGSRAKRVPAEDFVRGRLPEASVRDSAQSLKFGSLVQRRGGSVGVLRQPCVNLPSPSPSPYIAAPSPYPCHHLALHFLQLPLQPSNTMGSYVTRYQLRYAESNWSACSARSQRFNGLFLLTVSVMISPFPVSAVCPALVKARITIVGVRRGSEEEASHDQGR